MVAIFKFVPETNSGGGWCIVAAVGCDDDATDHCCCSEDCDNDTGSTFNIVFAFNSCTGTCNGRYRLYSLCQDGCAYKRCSCCRSHSNFTETHILLLQGFASHSIRMIHWHNGLLKSTTILFKTVISAFRCKDHTDFFSARNNATPLEPFGALPFLPFVARKGRFSALFQFKTLTMDRKFGLEIMDNKLLTRAHEQRKITPAGIARRTDRTSLSSHATNDIRADGERRTSIGHRGESKIQSDRR